MLIISGYLYQERFALSTLSFFFSEKGSLSWVFPGEWSSEINLGIADIWMSKNIKMLQQTQTAKQPSSGELLNLQS